MELKLNAFLILPLGEMSGQLHAPAALSSEKYSPFLQYRLEGGWVSPTPGLYLITERTVSISAGNRILVVESVVRCAVHHHGSFV